VALGFLVVANEIMGRPIREISVMRGFNIKEHILACFGGDGGQHATAVARRLGIRTVFLHRQAGILSALGLEAADLVIERQEPAGSVPLKEARQRLRQRLDELAADAEAELAAKGYEPVLIAVSCYLNLRYAGTDTAFMVPWPEGTSFEDTFSALHRRLFGFDLHNRVRARLMELARKARNGRQGLVFEAKDFLDDGSTIRLRLAINPADGSACFDFTGTGHEMWSNLNAPPAVTRSAIMYALRCLIDDDIPLNEGCLQPVTIVLPPGSLLCPSAHAAVAGGNVLMSQRIVDVIFRAVRAAAASQGCMNNLTFGNESFGYYETIGGGSGAGPGWHGCSGVHTHMNNTRITDPEILEQRYPVMLRESSIRRNSGGGGLFHGRDGLVRDIEFLAPLNVTILSERRVFQPYGLNGEQPGKTGQNLFISGDGRIINLGGKNEIAARPGDRIRILTPGGGGFQKAEDRSQYHG
jgi:hypothetical protein